MAARLGLQIYEWVNRFARKLAAKPGKEGIMTIPNQKNLLKFTKFLKLFLIRKKKDHLRVLRLKWLKKLIFLNMMMML